MTGDRRAQIVGVGDDVEHAGRDQILDQLGDLQGRERRGRGRLEHDGVAGQQRGRDLEGHQDQREVPGHDGPDHAQRLAADLDAALVVVLDGLGRQVEGGEVAEERRRAEHLAHRRLQRLALFLGQQARELRQRALDGVGHGQQRLAAFVDRGRGPGRERGLGGGDRLVELGLRGARADGDGLFGGRVDHVHRRVAGHQLAADQKLEVRRSSHLERSFPKLWPEVLARDFGRHARPVTLRRSSQVLVGP